MDVPEVIFFNEEPDEIRQAGYAMTVGIDDHVVLVESCALCAKLSGAAWRPALYEGQCRGCLCTLSGFPNEV